MKQLQTYFALFATLISVLAMALVFGTCAVFGHVNPALAFVILPISAVVLVIGMAVGHYLAEPLKALVAHVKQCRRNGGSGPSPENGVYREAHDLSEQFRLLYEDAESNRKELANVESNQSAFVSDVAHELRTPLTAIRGNAEMLQDPDLPPELHERFCNSIVRESERLTRLTTDIISLERNRDDDQAREWHRVNLRDVAQDAIDSIAPVLAERGANVSLEGEAPDVLGDRDHLEEVVTNLVDNASHFIKPGGHIWIELTGTETASIISVSDDGTGFGDVDPHMLFERFYRTDFSRAQNAGGSGLGLAIVKSIIEAHDGSVDAFNRPEGGACFMVAIPTIDSDDR